MIILNGSINLSKLDKSRFVKGKNGAVYVNFTTFVSDEPNEYGQDVSFVEGQTKEEREAKTPRNYIGNGKISYNSDKPVQQTESATTSEETEDLPF
jgi:hypothetical protein